MEKLLQTPSQTVGPFFAYSLAARQYGYDYNSIVSASLAGEGAQGERIYISGRVLDGKGAPVSDALVECWQADPEGNYVPRISGQAQGFHGFGRMGTGTDPQNRFRFTTVKPGSAGTGQAPHVHLFLFMRGSLRGLYTRMYFPEEDSANSMDELLLTIPEARRHTMIAGRGSLPDIREYVFDIRLQGPEETVFFEM